MTLLPVAARLLQCEARRYRFQSHLTTTVLK